MSPAATFDKFTPRRYRPHSPIFSTSRLKHLLRIVAAWATTSNLGLVFVMGLCIFLLLVFFHYFFTISTIEVVQDNAIEQDMVYALDGLDELNGKNLLLHTSESIRKHIISFNPALIDVEVEKHYPQTVRILIKPNPPVAHLAVDNDTYVKLSADGLMMGLAYERPLYGGIIEHYQKLTHSDIVMGKTIGLSDVRLAASMAGVLVDGGYDDFVIRIEDTHLITTQIDKTLFKMSTDSNHLKQLDALRHMLRIVSNGATDMRIVDLRFEKIIIEK